MICSPLNGPVYSGKESAGSAVPAEIRIRAERRCGQLMRGLERGKGTREKGGTRSRQKKPTPHRAARFSKPTPEPVSEYQEVRADAGISKIQAERWQELAAIPEEKFEEALRDPVLRSATAGIIVRASEPKKISPADPRALGFGVASKTGKDRESKGRTTAND